MKNKPYKIILSRGDDIPIDADEVDKVINSIGEGSVCVVRQGVFNPSFFISIVEDTDRKQAFLDSTKYPSEKDRRKNGPEKLKNIFSDTKLIDSISKNNLIEN